MLAIAKADRAAAIFVGGEVEHFLAVEAIGDDLLISDARGDLDRGSWLPQNRGADAQAVAAVDVLFAGRALGIDETGVFGVISDQPERCAIAQRHVDHTLEMAADIAFINGVDIAFYQSPDLAQFGLVGDVANRAADAARAEQRALRTAQGLDAVEIEQVEVGGEERQRDDRFVHVDADLLLNAWLIADDLAGRNAAHRHLALAGPEVLDGQAGNVAADILDGRGVGALDVLLGLRVDRERDFLEGRGALRRGDDDRLPFARVGAVRGLGLGFRCGLRPARGRNPDDGDTDQQIA